MRAALRVAALGITLSAAGPAWAQPRSFEVDPAASRVVVRVGRAGLLKFAGHEHEVVAPPTSGSVVADPDALGQSSVELRWNAADLAVTGKGEPAEDVPKVQARMAGAEVLDVARHPAIRFTSRSVSGRMTSAGAWELTVRGDLSIHGVTREVTLPMTARLEGNRLEAAGRYVLRQKDYGIKPVSVAGVVNVKNELAIEYTIVARAAN
jgi:polyisoprenoid-binding protein YceI